MKVGTDAVLLGAWANVDQANRILDIGTGSGILSLMIAQRGKENVEIDAVEIERQDAEQAKENISNSPWKNRITIFESAIQNFTPEKKYDVIVSNPPYFKNSFQPPDHNRLRTRHTVALDFDTLIKSVIRLLEKDGMLNVILPYTEGIAFIKIAELHQLHCSRHWIFRSRREKPIERLMLEFRFFSFDKEQGEIVQYEKDDVLTSGFTRLTKDFYLKL